MTENDIEIRKRKRTIVISDIRAFEQVVTSLSLSGSFIVKNRNQFWLRIFQVQITCPCMHDTTREKKRDTKVTGERSPHVDLLCIPFQIKKKSNHFPLTIPYLLGQLVQHFHPTCIFAETTCHRVCAALSIIFVRHVFWLTTVDLIDDCWFI